MMELDCTERCQRLHPHCTLQLTRSIAPDRFWFWSVTMPDGHGWAHKGGMGFEEAAASMYAEGLTELLRADERWREDHPVPPNYELPPKSADMHPQRNVK